MLPGSPIRPKDFTVVKSKGVFHCFYILNSASAFPDQTEKSFGHAISSDLYHWTQLPPVLTGETATWDSAHVWAPHIVQKDGAWWMFYTGVTQDANYNGTQRTGVAVSTDLVNWVRGPAPVFDASQTSWAWSKPRSSQPAFRDPFVMPDPDHPGSWLMAYTASYAPDTDATVIGLARSDGDFQHWTDVGPILDTWRAYTFNQVLESPHFLEHGGLWYLFVTTGSTQPISIYTAPSPTAPLAQWTYRGRLRSMLGYDTSSWYASETFMDGDHIMYSFVNGDRIEFREMVFGSSSIFSLMQPLYFHVAELDWPVSEIQRGDTTSLTIRLANPLSGSATIEAALVDLNGVETPVAPESLGIVSFVQSATDTLRLPWVARIWPRVPDSDTTAVMRFVLRVPDRSAESRLLTVRGKVAQSPHGTNDPGGDPTIEPPPTDPPERQAGSGPSLRPVTDLASVNATALAVGLPVAATARVDVYDVGGRRVRTLASGALPKGWTVLAWDGRDDTGGRLPRGVYFARLQLPGQAVTARLVLLDR
jgi:hypothetical protein